MQSKNVSSQVSLQWWVPNTRIIGRKKLFLPFFSESHLNNKMLFSLYFEEKCAQMMELIIRSNGNKLKIHTPFYLNTCSVTNSLTDLPQLIHTYSFHKYSVIFIYIACTE